MNLVDCSGDALIVTEAERVGRTGRIRIGASGQQEGWYVFHKLHLHLSGNVNVVDIAQCAL